MKLSDIDEMVKAKADYLDTKEKLSKVARCGGMGNMNVQVSGYGTELPWPVVGPAVIAAAEVALTKHHDELVAKLMLYGVEDWKK